MENQKQSANANGLNSYKTIADLLVIPKQQAADMIVSLIKDKKKDAIIDDIDEVVIMKEPNPMNDLFPDNDESR